MVPIAKKRAMLLLAQVVAFAPCVGAALDQAAGRAGGGRAVDDGSSRRVSLNLDVGLSVEANIYQGAFGSSNAKEVSQRATAHGVYPGWDRGMWGKVAVSISNSTGGWKPGDPINNSTKIPLGVGLNYLHQMLQMAVEVEHSVIPPYLTAFYSVISDGTDHEAWVATTIKDVVIEEMLHMTIACNVLNAVGGSPYIDRPDFVPNYPMSLPVLNISVGIEPFSITQAYKFRLIERPTGNDTGLADVAESSAGHDDLAAHGGTITGVYDYIVALMTQLCYQHGEKSVFTGNPNHQIALQSASVGESVDAVTNLTGAIQALYDVVEQGAGVNATDVNAGPLGGEYAHFVRFEEIYMGRMFRQNDTAASGPSGPTKFVNWTEIYQFQANPSPDDHPPGSQEAIELTWFANNYTDLLVELHDTFNGAPQKYFDTIAKMYQLNDRAVSLMQTPDPRFPNSSGVMLGPNWNWVANRSKYGSGWKGFSPMPPRPTWGG